MTARIARAMGACTVPLWLALTPWSVPVRADEVTPSAKAGQVLERHCAGCHQSGRTQGRQPDRFDNVLSLDDIARDESLVVPRAPDASRIYQRLIGAHTPFAEAARAAGAKLPTPDEIEAVRDWIDGLPERGSCTGRPLVSPASDAEHMRAWLSRLEPAAAGLTRFVSLAHLHNMCAPDARLAEHRATIAALLNRLSRRPQLLALETVGDGNTLLAFSLAAMDWQPAEWDGLVGSSPTSEHWAVPADLLASKALVRAGADPGLAISVPDIWALARSATADVGRFRAATEAGLAPDTFAEWLRDYRGDDEGLARRLLYGLLKRAEWQRLFARMFPSSTGAVAAPNSLPPPATASSSETIDLALWTDRTRYVAGDLVSFKAMASAGCHLTLISVDRDGKATVLFPNDLEPDNAIAPNVSVRVPGDDAGYQLRFDRAGPETVVGICDSAASKPDGITFNFERQRFASLGDWRAFLRTASRDGAPKPSRETSSRRKHRASPAPIDPDGPGREGRTAITVMVEEAPGHQAIPAP